MPHSTFPAHFEAGGNNTSNGSTEWNAVSAVTTSGDRIPINTGSTASTGTPSTGVNRSRHRIVASSAAGSRGFVSSSRRPAHHQARNHPSSSAVRTQTGLKPAHQPAGNSKLLNHQNSSNNTVATTETMTDSRFSCNICLEPVDEEPIVTQCGHLYCWPCLFRWLEPGMTIAERQSLQLPNVLDNGDASRRHCPVCKASCAVSTLIPIYVRSNSSGDLMNEDIAEIPVVARMEKEDPTNNSSQRQEHVTENPLAEATTSAMAVPVANRPSQTHLSEIDDKCSSSSTIATEQEDEDEDGNHGDSGVAASSRRVHGGGEEHENWNGESGSGQQQEPPRESTPPPAAALGALQRQRRAPGPDFPMSATLLVPNNNGDGMDHRPRAFSENAVGALRQQTGASRTLAISQGLALSLHRALQPTASTNSTAQAAARAAASMVVPPLHRPEGFGNAAAMNTSIQEESDPDATEFLSRILLMLASFVIFCLLLF